MNYNAEVEVKGVVGSTFKLPTNESVKDYAKSCLHRLTGRQLAIRVGGDCNYPALAFVSDWSFTMTVISPPVQTFVLSCENR